MAVDSCRLSAGSDGGKNRGGQGVGEHISLISAYDSQTDQSVIYLNNKPINNIEGEAYIYTNMNASAYYIHADGVVYCLDGKKFKKVMDGVGNIVLANHSQEVLIWTEEGGLYRYDGSELEQLTDRVVNYATISGDGQSYAYFSDGTSYVGKEPGEEQEVKDIGIFYLSEDGSLRYGFRSITSDYAGWIAEDNLWCYVEYFGSPLYLVEENGEKQLIADAVDTIVGFNETGTEFVYNYEGDSYISVNGAQAKLLSEYAVSGFVCGKTDNQWKLYTWPVETFKNCDFIAYSDEENELYCRITEDYQVKVCLEECMIIRMDEKFSKLLYQDTNWNLYQADIGEKMSGELVAECVNAAAFSPDGKGIYYSKSIMDEGEDEKEEIYYVEDGKDPKKLGTASYVLDFYAAGEEMYMSTMGNCYYVTENKLVELEGIEELEWDYCGEKIYGYGEDLYLLRGEGRRRLEESFGDIEWCCIP